MKMKMYIPVAKSGRSTLTYAKKFLVCCDGDKREAKNLATTLFGAVDQIEGLVILRYLNRFWIILIQ